MTLTEEQKKAVAGWAAAGDNLAAIQKKLTAEFKVSITYMDLRFLLDDLNVGLKDAAPKVDAVIGKPADAPAAGEPSAGHEALAEEDAGEPYPEDAPAAAGPVSVAVDKVNLIPGALASGTMKFADGVTGKWIVDNYGRPGITEVSKPGYRPSPADTQAFMQELSRLLQQQGY